MDFFELIQKRESCRDFSTRAPEREKLVKCIEAAHLSPSACNSQPWRFIIAEGEKAREVARCTQDMGMNKFTDKCPAFIVVTEEKACLKASVAERIGNQSFAPIDIGLSVAHLILAASAQGLSTCILGWRNQEKLRTVCGLSSEKNIPLVIAIGYAASDSVRAKSRKKIEEISDFI